MWKKEKRGTSPNDLLNKYSHEQVVSATRLVYNLLRLSGATDEQASEHARNNPDEIVKYIEFAIEESSSSSSTDSSQFWSERGSKSDEGDDNIGRQFDKGGFVKVISQNKGVSSSESKWLNRERRFTRLRIGGRR